MRELTYWYQSGVLFMLDDLTLLQRNILSLIAGTTNRGLNFHDYEIAHQFKVTEGAVVTALKILREKDYITTAKRKSPHRKLFASERTKAIIQKALDDAKLAKKQKATHTNGMGVENPTHTNGRGVTHTNGRGVLPIHLGECNRSKEVNQVNGDKEAPRVQKTNAGRGNIIRRRHWIRFRRRRVLRLLRVEGMVNRQVGHEGLAGCCSHLAAEQ